LKELESQLRKFFVDESFSEVSNNPMDSNGEIRSGMIPSIVVSLGKSDRVFEIGNIFRACRGEANPSEKSCLGVGISDESKSSRELHNELTSVLKDALLLIGLDVHFDISKEGRYPYLVSEFDTIVKVGDKVLGPLGIVKDKNIVACSLIINFIAELVTS